MSVCLSDVLKLSGYDCDNDIDDAIWLCSQSDDFDDLYERAKGLVENYEYYKEYCEDHEDDGLELPTFDEWRKR